MKKVFILVAFFMMVLPITSIFAADTGSNVALGATCVSTRVSGTLNWLVDANKSTSGAIARGERVTCTLAQTSNIDYYYFFSTSVMDQRFVGVTFKDAAGKTIVSSAPPAGTYIKDAPHITVAAPSVKTIEISVSSIVGTDLLLSDFIAISSDLLVNPDASKFVINNLNYTVSSDDSITLKWDGISSTFLKAYNVYQGKELIATVTTPTHKVNGLIPGNDYSFKVTAVDRLDKEFTETGKTVNYSIPLPDTTPPDKVQGVKVQPSNTSALVTWTKSSADDLAGYSVYLDGQKVTTSLLTSESYQLTGLKANTAYKAYVVAQDKTGNVSDKSDTVSFTTTNPATDSDQEQTPDYILVTWTATPGAVSYEILLNGKVVGTAPAGVTSFKITKAMGYNPQNMTNKTAVRAKFADGSTGGSNPGGGGNPFGGGWGFDSKDVWQNIVMLVGSLSIFLILGIVIKFAPRIFAAIRSAISAKKSY